ncbi:hypothetical protein CHGG_09188 [Chaetomium globosum CBS 148.51]|uniref:Uncharacterized protein n=1 Tax=Chaetomium globosum (strain ATCC 6205 / CBS 148.51 / DSM 1962 / NBRC 6347 / NRRL 1970) TaxID=306901 RepID=Q2GS66_CHAGB|nr:uncharacterized protein CHGG_09188 [Chaetomium globosum CBS 148.51]EAQ85174.1 hypothetical protein CHGG_09188 [Chaetomium globosum CBS 148.51]
MARAPPFSDTSPKELTRPFNQAPTVRVERNHPGVPDKEKATQISAPAKGSSSDAEAHRSPPAARNHDHAIPHFGSPSCNPQELLTDEAGKERRQSHPPLVPPTGGSRRFPGESADRTQNHMVNRPVKDIAHVGLTKAIHRVRPVSRSSNVSKQRSRCGSLASSPVIRQRRANISHEFTTGMAGVINQFTQQQSAALEEQKSKYHKYIKRLKRDLADGSGVIAQQISQIDSQASQINSLRDSQEHMMGQLKDIEAKLGASEDRGRKLEEKYRACKTHLNSAIKEQQDLYTRSKKHWGDTIEQINSLKQQIEEKEAELGQERESVRSLSERLQDLRATSSGFEELALQGKEILRELGEQHAKAEEHRNKSAEELQKRLNVIATRLQTLSDIMSGQPDAMCGIREAQDESLNIVTAKLDSILESRVAAADAAGQLSADLELHTGKIWQRLDSHLESLSKQLAEKAEENGMVSTLYKRKDAECEEHLNELAMLRATTEKQADQIHELEASLVVSDAAQDQNEETIRRLDERATETERLREEVNSKTAAVAELQRRLDTKEAAFSSELQNCSSNIQKLANALQEKDQFLNTAAQQAAEAARQEMRHEMEKAHAKTEKSLQETIKDRDSLASQIEELKRQVQEKETSQSRDAATMRLLQENLALEEERGKLATEKLTQRLTDLEEVENKLTARLKALEIELKAASDRAVGLKAENQRQHTRSETLISGLKRWAQRAGLFANGLDNLGDSHENVEKITEILTRTLGPLSVRLDARTGNPNVSLGDSLLGREDSKFFSSQNNQPIPEDLSTHTGIDPIMEGGKGDAMAKHLGTDDATEGTLDNDPLPYASRLHHMRRVVVRSPANVPNEPAAPSIDQEKMRRRGGTQPKSIMKRVTRSTSGMLRQGGNNTAANQGAFKRNRKDELSNGPALAHELEGIRGDTKAISAPEAEAAEDTSGAFPERPCKRRRSETARPDNSATFKSAGQDMKGNSSRPVPISNVEAVDRKDEVSIVAQSKGRRQENQPNTSSSHDLLKPTSVRNSRTYSGSNSQGLHRVPSANTRRALGSRQTNVRTYGSQRAAGGHSTEGQYTESRFPLRPQPQSRYWPPKLKEEPQDSKTFSQGIVTNENLLVPFRN